MIRETLAHIATGYLAATAEPFTGHPMAAYIRDDAAKSIADAVGEEGYIYKGSPGQGIWADVPWIAVFDPAVTSTATREYYVVYLFSADMQRVHLCLAQGTTKVREDFGTKTHDALLRYAGIMRDRLPAAPPRFSAGPAELHGHTTLARDYEPSVVFSADYTIAALPPEETLQADLKDMLRLYAMLAARGGRDNLEEPANGDGNDAAGDTIVERRRYRQHRKIERNSKAAKRAKQIHGYICQCCGFDFAAVYGEGGAEYIEAHHLTPLSELPEDVPVAQDPKTDFAVLCANCHRMIHRKDTPKTVDGLRALPGVASLIGALRGLDGRLRVP